MKRLEIKKPCSADWTKMTGTEKKRFCASCELEVEDFTDKSVEEIILYIGNKEGRTCGRLKKSQLNPIKKIAAAVMIGGMLAGSCAPDESTLNMGDISLDQELSADRTKILFRVKGVVLLGNGEKAVGAGVNLNPGTDIAKHQRIITKQDGSFSYEEVIPMSEFDNHKFEISYEGYDTYSVPLIKVNKEERFSVVLKETIESEKRELSFLDSMDWDGEHFLMGDIAIPPDDVQTESPFGIPTCEQFPEMKRKI